MTAVYILGVEHDMQNDPHPIEADDARYQIQQYEATLTSLLRLGRFTLICEETSHKAKSIAARLAAEFGIGYVNIDVTPEQRAQLGIPEGHLNKRNRNKSTQQQKDDWLKVRDVHMASGVRSRWAGHAEVLVVCGADHLPTLAARLQEPGIVIRRSDIRTQDWYRPHKTIADL